MSNKVGDSIRVVYQAGRGMSGLTVTMAVYDEAGALDAAKGGAMTEIGSTGRYSASFSPDAEGLWHVQINDSNGGKAVNSYIVGTTSVSEIGATVTTINAKIDAMSEKLDSPPMVA